MKSSKPKVTIASAFVGKELLDVFFDQIQGLIEEDVAELNYCVLDNSKDEAFSKELSDKLDSLGIPIKKDSVDMNDYTIESIGEQKVDISSVMAILYKKLLKEMTPKDSDFVLLIEDDIVCTSDKPLTSLLKRMEDNPDYGTIVGLTFGRRKKARGYARPQQWHFTEMGSIKVDHNVYNGLHQMGASAHGYWFTRRKLLGVYEQTNIKYGFGPDIMWGKQLKEDGKWKIGMDFDIECDHYDWIEETNSYQILSKSTYLDVKPN